MCTKVVLGFAISKGKLRLCITTSKGENYPTGNSIKTGRMPAPQHECVKSDYFLAATDFAAHSTKDISC